MKKILQSQSGTSLVELLISGSIMAYVVSAIIVAYVHNVALNEASRNVTIATSHADHALEDIRDSNLGTLCTDINAGNWNWSTDTDFSSRGLMRLNSESILAQCTATTPLTVTLTVSWNDLRSRPRSETWQTLVRGL